MGCLGEASRLRLLAMASSRMNWTEEEVAGLKAGVAKYGVGNWAPILTDKEVGPLLTGRTNVNIKDKWRWLEQHGLTDSNASIKRPKLGKRKTTDEGYPKKRARTDREVYCICRKPETPGRMMLGCDTCDEWFHPVCVGLSDNEARELDKFKCPLCKAKKKAEKAAAPKQQSIQQGTMKSALIKRKKDDSVKNNEAHKGKGHMHESSSKTKDPVQHAAAAVKQPVREVLRPKETSARVFGRRNKDTLANDPKVKFAVKVLLQVLRADNDEGMDLDIGFGMPSGLDSLEALFLPGSSLDLEGLDLLVHAAALDVEDAVESAKVHGWCEAARGRCWGFSPEDQENDLPLDESSSPALMIDHSLEDPLLQKDKTVTQRSSQPQPSALAKVVQRAKKKMESERGTELTVSTSTLSLRPDVEFRPPQVDMAKCEDAVQVTTPEERDAQQPISAAVVPPSSVPRSAQGSEANAFYHFVESSSPARVIEPAFSARLGNTAA